MRSDWKEVLPELAVAGARCLLLGAGRSGVAAGRLLEAHGVECEMADEKNSPDLPSGRFDLCVANPAIPTTHRWFRECRERGIGIVGEMELGYAFWRGRILAVTGSKGKSSIVKLCADTLTAAGREAVPCGNYGVPLSAVCMDNPGAEWAVAETSSFQLETIRRYRPDVSLLLNVQADHLDRHGSMREYARMKMRLFENQGEGDAAFIPDDVDWQGNDFAASCNVATFGRNGDWRYERGRIVGNGEEVDFAGTWFDNPILGLAAAGAVGALRACGVSMAQVKRGLADFKSLPHRMQRLGSVNGVEYIDDSKATSLAATAAALQMVGRRVRLIAGGRLKERDLAPFKFFVAKHAEKVYLIGESSRTFNSAWGDVVPCEDCHDMAGAVEKIAAEAKPGEVALLSPGCASFDQFSGYGERGDCFAKEVAAMQRPQNQGNRQ